LHLLADEQLLKEHFRPTARIEINRWHHHRAWGGRLRLLPATGKATGRGRKQGEEDRWASVWTNITERMWVCIIISIQSQYYALSR
jgi:hypothetical protein